MPWRHTVIEEHAGLLDGALGPGEQLLWAGRPRQGVMLRSVDAFLIPFSLMWGGFAIFWEVSVLTIGAPWFFALWGVPFVLAGLYIMFGRFWFDARQRAATAYAVTPERVVIVSGVFSRRIKSLAIDTITDMTLTERKDGGGTITFGAAPALFWLMNPGAGWPSFGHDMVPTIELDADARGVYEMIRSAQREAKQ
jgi:hypothetical protein